MNAQTIIASTPDAHSEEIQGRLEDLIIHTRKEQELVTEPRFQALLETSAEVLKGLKKAFSDYNEGTETAWKR
jgi:hypothetical protein